MTEEREVTVNLENIQTLWSLVQQAHDDSGIEARKSLVLNYAPAIRKFVRVVVRDENLADELAQDAILRLLRGDFAGADPQRGRFRDLLKVAIRNMARNYWAKEKRRAGVDYDPDLMEGAAAEELDDAWTRSWRDSLLRIAWAKLEQFEQQNPSSRPYLVLKLRSELPQATSQELAEKLSEATGDTISDATYRQQLRRARVRFGEYLVNEVANGLEEPTPRLVQDELIGLGLFESIRDVLPKQWREETV